MSTILFFDLVEIFENKISKRRFCLPKLYVLKKEFTGIGRGDSGNLQIALILLGTPPGSRFACSGRS